MVTTRSNSLSSPSQPADTNKNGAGTKRKAESGSSPSTKRGKKGSPKTQKTLEETMPDVVDNDDSKDVEMPDSQADDVKEPTKDDKATEEKPKDVHMNGTEGSGIKDPAKDKESTEAKPNGDTEAGAEKPKDDEEQPPASEKVDEPKPETKEESKEQSNGEVKEKPEKVPAEEAVTKETGKTDTSSGAIERSSDEKQPSNIIEKGIIYFFTRARVGVEDPDSVQDLARTYMVLRPLPADAKLGEGAIQDLKNNRLLALPKKVLPKSHQDRFMTFVEKSGTTMEDLKENFFQGSEYETQTLGTRQTQPVTPVGEGVYAITIQGSTSHLAYMLTIPSELGEVQNELGIRSKGSFQTSVKNPERKGPANATLDQPAQFPQDILDEFRGRAWMPLARSEHLNYANAQFLLIGEGEHGFEKATESTSKDEKSNESIAEHVEKLEQEDEVRVEHLHGDNTVFDDLGISHKDYPKVLTTW